MFGVTEDNAETVELLLENSVEVNACDTDEGFTALTHSAAEGYADAAKVLLEYDAEPATRDAGGDSA